MILAFGDVNNRRVYVVRSFFLDFFFFFFPHDKRFYCSREVDKWI